MILFFQDGVSLLIAKTTAYLQETLRNTNKNRHLLRIEEIIA